MGEIVGEILRWAIPPIVVFVVAALAVAAIVWAVRRARWSPKARAGADAARAQAGAALVRLDDAVDELELEVGLSGALYGGGAPPSLRRARITAQHVRDESFDTYRALGLPGVRPDEVRRGSARIQRRAEDALGTIAAARREHDEWMRANVSASRQIDAARIRLDRLRAGMGDPTALVDEMAERFAPEEWSQASGAAEAALAAADEAGRLLATAEAHADDPSRSALTDLAAAEKALRTAETETRLLEETHRMVTQAALALPSEFDAARSALRQATSTREALEPGDSDRLGGELRAISAELDALEPEASRRPTRTIDRIARLRDRLDLALGDARTAQQRLRGARTALPGTLAAARTAIAHAESAVTHARAGAEARSRLMSAQDELAGARSAQDPVAALDAARRAMRDAEDAKALADYDRLGR